ncbi:MAG: serine/threonine phosphatase, partial [Leptolyngbya sp. SIO4C5]|nr:serine/threonine phosphatase [Leptolyngbya sp. SIO4C5]
MLICSYCQFENPYSNKFCQNCGSPLTLLLAIVTLSAAQAGNNAAECAEPPALTAAIEPLPPASTEAPQPSAGEPKPNHADEVGASLNSTLETATLSQAEAASSFAEGPTPDSLTAEAIEPMGKASDSAAQTLEPILSLPTPTLPPELTKSYLDSKQRYQVQQPLSPTTFSHLELEAEVIDAHPAEPRPLAETEEQLVELAEETDESEAVDTVLSAALPASAQPYLLLQSSFFPAIPELHSAWQTQDYSVLIVEHRGHLPKLFDYWRTEASEPLQQVHWCYEMAELWQVLEPHQGQPSLLNIENLRIDEDQVLCLQRLYFQSAEMRYTLRDLGLLWQIMLQQVPDALSDLVTLASDLGSGQLETIETLQARLVAIADGVLQSNEATAANLSPDLEAAASAMPSGGEAVGAEAAGISALSPLIETDLDLEETLGLEAESLTNDSPTMVLPMMLVELEDAGLTHVGQQREHNEDTFCIQSQSQRLATPQERRLQAKGLYILCDGMGGHESGEVASALAVETLQSYFEQHWQDTLPTEKEISQAIAQTNDV